MYRSNRDFWFLYLEMWDFLLAIQKKSFDNNEFKVI